MTTITASEKQVDIKAAAWSIGIHIALIALFSYIVFLNLPDEPVLPEMAMEVNLGTDENGSGTDQPMSIEDPAPDMASSVNKTRAQQSSASTSMMTSDEKDAPSVNNPSDNKRVNPNNTRVNTATRNNPTAADNSNNRPQRPRYVYSGATGAGGNSATENRPGTGEGNTTGPGDRGVPGGTPGATNYIGHNLGGRDISPRVFAAEFREGGTVVIRVTVNREGQIVNKVVKSSPSAELTRIAMQKIGQAKFSKNPNAAPEQMGDVTIRFKASK